MSFKRALSHKIFISFLLAGIIPSALLTFIVYWRSSELLFSEAREALIANRESKAFEIKNLYSSIFNLTKALTAGGDVESLVKRFSEAAESLPGQTGISTDAASQNLERYYERKFLQIYKERNGAKPLSFENWSFDKVALLLQESFSKNSSGQKEELANRSDYFKLHSEFHPVLSQYAESFGFYDLLLISPNGRVVYSAAKELDFGFDLSKEPLRKSALGEVFYNIVRDTDKKPHVSKMQKYLPSYDAPAQFVAAKLFDGDKFAGVLALQVPVGKINAITTGLKGWANRGEGQTGESLLIRQDGVMLTDSRFWFERKEQLLADINLSESDRAYMAGHDTTALTLSSNLAAFDLERKPAEGFLSYVDYRGKEVFVAFKKLDFAPSGWILISKIDEEELLAPIFALTQVLVVTGLLALVGCFALAVYFSSRVSLLLGELKAEYAEKLKLQEELATQSRLAGLGALAAGIAHEIKNPLNIILNASEIINEVFKGSETAKTVETDPELKMAAQAGDQIYKHAQRAADITKTMLSLARGDRAPMESCKLNEIVDENLAFAYQSAKFLYKTEVALETELEEVVFQCSKTDFSRALLNLYDNSFHALKSRKEKDSTFEPTLRVSLKKQERGFSLSISDNGIGMDEEVRKKALDPFFTTKDPGEGTGLGLSFVNDVVSRHGGELEIDSKPGQGTTVVINVENK